MVIPCVSARSPCTVPQRTQLTGTCWYPWFNDARASSLCAQCPLLCDPINASVCAVIFPAVFALRAMYIMFLLLCTQYAMHTTGFWGVAVTCHSSLSLGYSSAFVKYVNFNVSPDECSGISISPVAYECSDY